MVKLVLKYIKDFRMWYWGRKFATCGKNLNMARKVRIDKPENVEIGDDCNINRGVTIIANCGGNVKIGNFVTLSANSQIISTQYDLEKWKNEKRHHIGSEVYIGDNVWICAGTVVLPGVKITGKNVVVGAGSVLTKSIEEDNVLWAGNPAHKIKNI